MSDRSRFGTGYFLGIELTTTINLLGRDLEYEETEPSGLIKHQRMCLARGGPLAENLFYYPGVDVGCGHCSDQIWSYLSYHPEDREPYLDDEGEIDWEAIQSELETGGGMATYAFHTDRGESLTCDNCRNRFRVVDERVSLYHANAGGATIPPAVPGGRDSEDLHGHLCDPCMEWFRSRLVAGRIVK